MLEEKENTEIAIMEETGMNQVDGNQASIALELSQVKERLRSVVAAQGSTKRNDMLQPKSLAEVFDLSVQLANSGMMRFKPKDAQEISVRIITGMEMGFSAMQSIRNIYNVHGIPSPSTQGLVSLVISSPFCMYFKKVDEESGVESCTVETLRIGYDKPSRYTFTIAEAEKAGLMGKDNWKHYPAVMLYKRAAAFLCREVYPDVVMGLHTVEEMESMAYSETEKQNEAEVAIQKERAEAMLNIESKIKELTSNESTKSFAGHLMDGFNNAKRVDYIADASHKDVISFAKWLSNAAPHEVIAFVASKSKSYTESLEKKVNPAPPQETPEGIDQRDKWKEANRHVRAVMSENNRVQFPDEVLRAFKIAKGKKSLTEIPAEQIRAFTEDLQSFGGDRIKGSRVIDDEMDSTVRENAEAFRRFVLQPDNKKEIEQLYSEVFENLDPETTMKIESKFVLGFDNINALEELPGSDIDMLRSLLSGGIEDVEAYIGGLV